MNVEIGDVVVLHNSLLVGPQPAIVVIVGTETNDAGTLFVIYYYHEDGDDEDNYCMSQLEDVTHNITQTVRRLIDELSEL